MCCEILSGAPKKSGGPIDLVKTATRTTTRRWVGFESIGCTWMVPPAHARV